MITKVRNEILLQATESRRVNGENKSQHKLHHASIKRFNFRLENVVFFYQLQTVPHLMVYATELQSCAKLRPIWQPSTGEGGVAKYCKTAVL